MTASTNKDLAALERVATSQGWTVEVTGGGHLKWCSPSGKSVFTSLTPRGGDGVRKAREDLRRAGLVVEGEKTVTRRRKKVRPVFPINLPTPGVLNIDEYVGPATEHLRQRVRVLMGHSATAPWDEVKTSVQLLPRSHRDILSSWMLRDTLPSVDCDCGKSFQSAIFAEIHRQKCIMTAPVVPEPNPEKEVQAMIPESVQTEQSEQFICETCNAVLPTRQALGGHSTQHRKWVCPNCDREFGLNAKGNHSKACMKISLNLRERVRCNHCFREMQKRSFSAHVLHFCPAIKAKGIKGGIDDFSVSDPRPKPEMLIPSPTAESAPTVQVEQTVTQAPTSVREAMTAATSASESPEELVTEVLDLLFPHGFKARHLPAITKWQELTLKLLHDVEQ